MKSEEIMNKDAYCGSSCQPARLWLSVLCAMGALGLHAQDHYVACAGQTPSGNFTSWATAASNIAEVVTVAPQPSTIWISNGTYTVTAQITTGNRVFRSFNKGELDRDGTVIRGDYPFSTNRVFRLNHADALVEGFTITNGYHIRTSGTQYTIDGGGGVLVEAGTLRNCLITGNTCENASEGGGSGVRATGASSLIDTCDLVGNSTSNRGGGAYVHNSAQIWNSRAISNSAAGYGAGGIMVRGSLAVNCIMFGNAGTSGGGASTRDRGRFRNCLIWGNTGSGLFNQNERDEINATIENCTIIGNVIGGYTSHSVTNYFWNTIIVGAFSGYGVNVFTHCLLPSANTSGPGNRSGYPGFADADGHDYRLRSDSQAVNAGLNQAWMADAVDLGGCPRLDRVTGSVDMGAYEYLPEGALFLIR